MSLVVQLSDFVWLQSLGFLKDTRSICEMWNKLEERCQNPSVMDLQQQSHNEAEKLRPFVKNIQDTVLPKLKYEKCLVIDNQLTESNPFPNLLDAIWRIEPDLPYPETAVYIKTLPEINHLPYLTQLKHLKIFTGMIKYMVYSLLAPEDAPDYDLFPLLIDAIGVTLESLRFNPLQFEGNLMEISRCPNLKKLSLISVSGIDPTVFLSTFGPNNTITELILEYGFPFFQEDHWSQLSSALPYLNTISVKIASKEEEPYVYRFLQQFPNVKLELSIWHNDPSFVDIASQYNLVSLSATFRDPEHIHKLQQCRNLKQLYLAYLSDEGIANLVSSVPALRVLRLYDCNATEESFTKLAKQYPDLEHLELIKGNFTDSLMKVFTDECPKIKKVLVRDCKQLTESGRQYFVEKRNLPVETATPSPSIPRHRKTSLVL